MDEISTLTEQAAFDVGSEGDEAWDEVVDAKKRSFAGLNRTNSTDLEHERYYINLSKTDEDGAPAFCAEGLMKEFSLQNTMVCLPLSQQKKSFIQKAYAALSGPPPLGTIRPLSGYTV